MSRMLPSWLVLLIALGACDPAAAQEHVTLHATHPDGVPLHPSEGSRTMSGRLPDGLRVNVLRWGDQRRWLEVRAPDGRQGWIVVRYLTRSRSRSSSGSRSSQAPVSPTLDTIWRSAASCAASPAPSRSTGHNRVASWNLRWFPDGSSHGPSQHPTDVAWMACSIASLDVDLIAVQEVILHQRGRAAIERLTRELSARTGGRWQSRFDECPRDGRQHVGLLFDAARVELSNVRPMDAVNPLGGCRGRLRPGLRADARFADGRRLRVVTVHLDSGTEERDHGHRVQSVEQLASDARSGDLLILGDFNTMGTRGAARVDPALELADLDTRFGRAGLRRLSATTACTEFYRRHGSLLDLAIISSDLRSGATLEVAGLCSQLQCALPRGAHPEALTALSDHCPIVVDLAP